MSDLPAARVKPREKHRFQVKGGRERAREGEEERVLPFKRAEQRRGRGGASHKGFSPALSAGFAGGGKYRNIPRKTPFAFRTPPNQGSKKPSPALRLNSATTKLLRLF